MFYNHRINAKTFQTVSWDQGAHEEIIFLLACFYYVLALFYIICSFFNSPMFLLQDWKPRSSLVHLLGYTLRA